MRNLKKILNIMLFIYRNILYSSKLKNIFEKNIAGSVVIGGARKKDLNEVYAIYANFNNNHCPEISKRVIYFLMSKKIIFCARNILSDKIIGVELYYLNKRDIVDRSIHQGFRGVLSEWQGQKIGTSITSYAINHFKNIGINGISSRISLNNLPSLKSNLNLGFRPVEKYFDNNMKDERYYLVCQLNNNAQWSFISDEKRKIY